MASGDFNELLKRQPFVSFRLHMTNGVTFDIHHPELAVLRYSVVWHYSPKDQLPILLADRISVVVLSQIIHIEFLATESGSKN